MSTNNNEDKPGTIHAYVGTWGTDSPDAKSSHGGGGGIYSYTFDLQDGSLKELDRAGSEINAGMLCFSPDQHFLYCTDERSNWEGRPAAGGGVHAFAIDPTHGTLQYIDGTASMGVYPCYITVDRRGTYVFVVNHGEPSHKVTKVVPDAEDRYRVEAQYDDGVVSVYPVRRDGGIGHVCDVKILTGRSLHPVEQASAHPHSINIDPKNNFAFVCDKGADRLITYRINHATGMLEFVSSLETIPESGPRHLTFHPSLPYFFTSNELNSTISSFEYDPETGEVAFVQDAPSISRDHKGASANNYPADVQIHPSGRFVCVSNRGDDSIAMYDIDPRTASLTPICFTPTQGNFPRALAFDPTGEYLFAANQHSGTIISFSVDQKSGSLSPTGAVIKVPSPVCIKLLKFDA